MLRVREPRMHDAKQKTLRKNGRDDWIRTSDLTHPKGARYQASLRPDRQQCEVGFTALSGYHLRSRSVKKARKVSRRSNSILRLKSCPTPSAAAALVEPMLAPVAPELSPSP